MTLEDNTGEIMVLQSSMPAMTVRVNMGREESPFFRWIQLLRFLTVGLKGNGWAPLVIWTLVQISGVISVIRLWVR